MMQAAEAFDVRARRMFSGMGIYTGEKMFAYLYDEEIGLKLAPDDLNMAMALPGAGPVAPSPDSDPMPQYVRMPREVLDNFDSFTYWVNRSAEFARSRCIKA